MNGKLQERENSPSVKEGKVGTRQKNSREEWKLEKKYKGCENI